MFSIDASRIGYLITLCAPYCILYKRKWLIVDLINTASSDDDIEQYKV